MNWKINLFFHSVIDTTFFENFQIIDAGTSTTTTCYEYRYIREGPLFSWCSFNFSRTSSVVIFVRHIYFRIGLGLGGDSLGDTESHVSSSVLSFSISSGVVIFSLPLSYAVILIRILRRCSIIFLRISSFVIIFSLWRLHSIFLALFISVNKLYGMQNERRTNTLQKLLFQKFHQL